MNPMSPQFGAIAIKDARFSTALSTTGTVPNIAASSLEIELSGRDTALSPSKRLGNHFYLGVDPNGELTARNLDQKRARSFQLDGATLEPLFHDLFWHSDRQEDGTLKFGDSVEVAPDKANEFALVAVRIAGKVEQDLKLQSVRDSL